MALRDAIKPFAGARTFAQGLYDFLHGTGDMEERFTRWCCEVVVGASAPADTGSDMAGCHRFRLHCSAGQSHFSQTDCHTESGGSTRRFLSNIVRSPTGKPMRN